MEIDSYEEVSAKQVPTCVFREITSVMNSRHCRGGCAKEVVVVEDGGEVEMRGFGNVYCASTSGIKVN